MKNDTIKKMIGGMVKTCRQSRKLTQKELAEMAGTTASVISEIENGKRNLSIDNACVLFKKINYSFSFSVTDDLEDVDFSNDT
jgi:transcriptional regulator with XRE-family HTH domain